MRAEINDLSVQVGREPLLVQGAGGNISWKENGSIFVKGSGTWLSDALERDIYVELDLKKVISLIYKGSTDYQSAVIQAPENSRPSIETALHALLPFKVVLHLHPVDIIALTVSSNAKELLSKCFFDLNWLWIDYAKPGRELADNVMNAIEANIYPAKIIVLENHGLVLASESVYEMQQLLSLVTERVRQVPRHINIDTIVSEHVIDEWKLNGYRYIANRCVESLSHDYSLLNLCKKFWVLYPDHAVFLGNRVLVCNSPTEIRSESRTPVVIVPDVGVFLDFSASKAAESMLICYAEVLMRLRDDKPKALSEKSVAELLDWDAEKFRKSLQL